MTTFIAWLDLCLAGVGLYFVKKILWKGNTTPFPPGPKPLPILGNMLDMPSVKPWLVFSDWSNKFGTIVTTLRHLAMLLPSFAR